MALDNRTLEKVRNFIHLDCSIGCE